MGYTIIDHPTEEELIEYAVDGVQREEILEHLASCSNCSEFIEEMKSVKDAFGNLEDEDVSPSVTEKIFAATKKETFKDVAMSYIQNWYKYPFFLGLLTIGAVLLFYFLITYIC